MASNHGFTVCWSEVCTSVRWFASSERTWPATSWPDRSEPSSGRYDVWTDGFSAVPDVAAALERVAELGGAVIHAGERWAICRDSE